MTELAAVSGEAEMVREIWGGGSGEWWLRESWAGAARVG